MSQSEHERALNALAAIPAGLPREAWHKIGRAAIAAGLSVEELDAWSSTGENYAGSRDVESAFRAIKPDGGTTAGTLYAIAYEHGWGNGNRAKPNGNGASRAVVVARSRQVAPSKGDVEMIWQRCVPATHEHPYIVAKHGSPDGLRVIESDVGSLRVAGWLAVPLMRQDGTISTIQFIQRGPGNKLNLAGHKLEGWFTVGEVKPGAQVYVCEGLGQAWACWQATGNAAVVCFGWGRVGIVAAALRALDDGARLVIVADVGKEAEARAIGVNVCAAVACMPEGWPANSDVNDLALRDGPDVLADLLGRVKEPRAPGPHYKLLSRADILAMPDFTWCVKGVFPAVGLSMIFGPTMSGKSFLALDVAVAIAEGRDWFGHKVKQMPVIYCAFEAALLVKLQVKAWEMSRGREIPASLQVMLQPFNLVSPDDADLIEFAKVVLSGTAVFFDTMNRITVGLNENDPRDSGLVLAAASKFQELTAGLTVLVHHTGKDETRGPRGHTTTIAGMDSAIQLEHDGSYRTWKIFKCKGGVDGVVHPFKLEIQSLGDDADGDAITSCTIALTTDEKPHTKNKRTSAASGAIMEFLRSKRSVGVSKREVVEHFKDDFVSTTTYREIKNLVRDGKVNEFGSIVSASKNQTIG